MKVILALAAALPISTAYAALEGELWEVSTQMNIPGMPAGMGGQKQRVCTEKGDNKKVMQGKDSSKCKVTDLKESGNKVTMTMQCPEGTMVMENTYNAAHTEYNGSMKMKSKDGEFTMNMAGKKLGACDLQVAQADRDDSQAKARAMQADMAAMTAKMNADMEANKQQAFAKLKSGCEAAVTKMDYHDLALALCDGKDPVHATHCLAKSAKNEKERQGLSQFVLPPENQAFCEAKKKEFCGSLQTEAGFAKAAKTEHATSDTDDEGKRKATPAAERIPASSAYCGLKSASVAASLCSKALTGESFGFLAQNCPAEAKASSAKLCPRAVETDHYNYVGAYCPVEAKAQYTKYCAGRDFTSMYQKKDKNKFQMCMALGTSVEEDQSQVSRIPTSTQGAVDAAKQGVNQSINKIKGLFGK